MQVNEGTLDRAVRVIAGIGLVAAAATGAIGAWGFIGVVPIATGLIGWCPAYTLLGFSTCALKK